MSLAEQQTPRAPTYLAPGSAGSAVWCSILTANCMSLQAESRISSMAVPRGKLEGHQVQGHRQRGLGPGASANPPSCIPPGTPMLASLLAAAACVRVHPICVSS